MPADYSRLKELFLAALKLPAAPRAAYLDTACAGDTTLRQEIEGMLESHAKSGELLPRTPGEMLQEIGAADAEATSAFRPPPLGSGIHPEPCKVSDQLLGCLAPSSQPGHLGRLGHYEILGVLGKGGFGTVLRAFDEKLHRVVAIKVLAPELAAHGTARKRFIREAQAAAAVKNDHIVAIYNVEDEHQPPYLVMELIDGVSLEDHLKQQGPLELKEILRIGMQIAEGLAAAHKQGLVHRDIKPANILLENGVQRVKITDFGLARANDDASVTQSGVIAGTPMFMAPEQAMGDKLDHRADLFSLGSVLYVMCTGRAPFRASTTMAVLRRVCDDTPTPIREINPDVPAWLCAIVEKLQAKQPEDRYGSAREVAELLEKRLAEVQRAGSAGEDSGRQPTPVAHASSSSRKRLAAAGASLLALAILLGVVYWPKGGSQIIPSAEKPPVTQTSETPATQPEPWALALDGKGAVRVPKLVRNEQTPLTLECWCRLDPQPDQYCALWVLGGTEGLGISYGPNGNCILAYNRAPPNSPGTSPVRPGKWAHIAAVVDELEGRLYLDGTLQRRLSLHESVEVPADPPRELILGATLYGPNLGSFMTGQFRAVRVSGSARYDANFTPPERFTSDEETLALYRFDEGQGDKLIDSSGNNLHGAISGARWVRGEPTTTAKVFPAIPKPTPVDPQPPPAVAPFDAKTARAHQEAWAQHLGIQIETPNSVGQTMILIPPGEFQMGSTDEQVAAAVKAGHEIKAKDGILSRIETAERPQHHVVISRPLLMSATEVTIGQFKKFSATGFVTQAEKAAQTPATTSVQTYLSPGYFVTDDCPAAVITWHDAVAYCQWLSSREKRTYRLPTEAEWEYACRAGTATQYSFGDDYNDLPKYGWYGKTPEPDWVNGKTRPVAGLLSNPFGLFDMHGNLWEWCGDSYEEKRYEKSSSADPVSPSADLARVLRGGAFLDIASRSRSAYRHDRSPYSAANTHGFRCVMEW